MLYPSKGVCFHLLSASHSSIEIPPDPKPLAGKLVIPPAEATPGSILSGDPFLLPASCLSVDVDR
jgi:hypothetical protein